MACRTFCVLSPYQSAYTVAAAGDSGRKELTSIDASEKQTRLAAGIANGLLVAMAIVVMSFRGWMERSRSEAAGSSTRRRQTELKCGLISMSGTVGYITPELTGKLPGYFPQFAGLMPADTPIGLGTVSKVPAACWGQIVAYCALCELSQDKSAGPAAAARDSGGKMLTSNDASVMLPCCPRWRRRSRRVSLS